MKKVLTLWLVALLPVCLTPACMYSVLSSRTETRMSDARTVESGVTYTVERQSMIGENLVLNLGRQCWETQEGNQDTVLIENREYDMSGAWIGTGTVVGLGLITAFMLYMIGQGDIDSATFFGPDDIDQDLLESGESMQDTAKWVALGSLGTAAAMVVGILIFDSSDAHESETLVDRSQSRQGPIIGECRDLWPSGAGTLIAPDVGRQFAAHADGTDRIEVDLSAAPVQMWDSTSPMQLELPGLPEWIAFSLDPAVRSVGLNRAGQAELQVNLSFDDSQGNANGTLDPGEVAYLVYEVLNNSDVDLSAIGLELETTGTNGIDLQSSLAVGALSVGGASRGQIPISAADDVRETSAIVEASARSSDGTSGLGRLSLAIGARLGPERAYIWYEEGSDYDGLMATGSVRIQTVLTDTGRYAFVADTETRSRIETAVQHGGGSPQDRLRAALEAANAETIRKVFQLSVNPVAGNHIQIVLSVYETSTTDRIFLRDAPVDSQDAMAVLDAFDQLARAFVDWAATRGNSR